MFSHSEDEAITASKKVISAFAWTGFTVGDPSVARHKTVFVTVLDEHMTKDETWYTIIKNNSALRLNDTFSTTKSEVLRVQSTKSNKSHWATVKLADDIFDI